MTDTMKLSALALAALLLAGCAALQRGETQRMEALLVAAGFRIESADTAEKLANLKQTPPRKLVSNEREGHVVYTYADPDRCVCLYVGGPQEYSEYQRLVETASADENYHVAPY